MKPLKNLNNFVIRKNLKISFKNGPEHETTSSKLSIFILHNNSEILFFDWYKKLFSSGSLSLFKINLLSFQNLREFFQFFLRSRKKIVIL